MIEQPSPKVYDELLSIWEEAVRSTHHFLTEADIQFYKPLIRHEYLAAVRLYIIREDSGTIAAFMGLSNDCIEMLFVRPNAHGHGYGSRLVEFAIRKKRIYKVDVNGILSRVTEQNAQHWDSIYIWDLRLPVAMHWMQQVSHSPFYTCKFLPSDSEKQLLRI